MKKQNLPGKFSWAKKLQLKLGKGTLPEYSKHARILNQSIATVVAERTQTLKSTPSPVQKLILQEQPFDLELLSTSLLFQTSRRAYLKSGGTFVPSLLSSPRSLTSAALLDSRIEYSPIESEMIWLATDPIESRRPERLMELRTFSTSLFHEQNHRILWKLLPEPPRTKNGLRKYLNFVESLVIALDMALADQLGVGVARLFYLIGVAYDPGSTVYAEAPSVREYRNYLQAVLHASYLTLEGYETQDVSKVIEVLFPGLGSLAGRAARRSGNLDRAFIEETNHLWQMKHEKVILKKLCGQGKARLDLPDNPLDHRQEYILGEEIFNFFGL